MNIPSMPFGTFMKNGVEKKNEIFSAAEDLFLRFGIHGVSLAQIAKQASVPASLICHHYGTKEALWEAIVRHHLARLMDVRKNLYRKDGRSIDRLRSGLHAYHLELARDEKLRRFMLWCDVDGTLLRFPEVQADFEAGVALVMEAQRDGFLPLDHDPRQLFLMLMGIAEYPMMWRDDYLSLMEGVPQGVVDAQYLRLLDLVLGGLLPKPAGNEV
jgi:TetR/AcrR family transcriptional regulator